MKNEQRSFSPPNQFKFTKVQALKLTVIQAALTPKIKNSEIKFDDDVEVEKEEEEEGEFDSNTYPITVEIKNDPFNLDNNNSTTSITEYPQEAFMATISTLIAGLNRAAFSINNNNNNDKDDASIIISANYNQIDTTDIFIFKKNLLELLKLFTAVFIKNMNLVGILEVFGCQVEGTKVSFHLLTAYINFISTHSNTNNNNNKNNNNNNHIINNVLLEESLRSLLVLISSNLLLPQKLTQIRYFHSCVSCELSLEHFKILFESLLGIVCTFNHKSLGFLSSTPSLSDKSRLASQLIVTLLLPVSIDTGTYLCTEKGIDNGTDKDKGSDSGTDKGSDSGTETHTQMHTNTNTNTNNSNFSIVLKEFNDLKTFSLFIKFNSQILQTFPNFLSLNDLTILTFLSSAMINFCPNYRRFVLSKLDIDEFLVVICRVMYGLMRGKLNKKSILSINLYLWSEIILSLTEDGAFLKQIFDSVLNFIIDIINLFFLFSQELDLKMIKWYEGDIGTTSNLGGFIFCLLFDLIGANLAFKDGFKVNITF